MDKTSLRTDASHNDAGARKDPYSDPNSLEFGFRAKRFAAVQDLIERILAERGEADILDLGGTEAYWRIAKPFLDANRGRIRITMVNPETFPVEDTRTFVSIEGDATDPELFHGRVFDLVHSNSVIEHVGWWADMRRFADNTRRLGRRYYMQTPNYWFPYEPHFRFPGFQYLPSPVRVAMLRRMRLGFFRPVPDRAVARDIIDHHRLVSASQVKRLFPDAAVSFEKVIGLNKSIMAIRAEPVDAPARTVVTPPAIASEIADLAGEQIAEKHTTNA